MPKFYETVGAGARAEEEVYNVLRRYTRHVYRNCRVETLFTKTGDTEMDIVAAVADVILIAEVKNVRLIEGTPVMHYWTMEGRETGQRYSSLNVFTQNRIHVRSLKDAWLVNRRYFPTVISVVVVPNGCRVPQELRDAGVLEVTQFAEQLAQMASREAPLYGYELSYLFGSDESVLRRPDFK